MEISIDTLLKKMEEELLLAKQSGTQHSLRERISSIKTLCELILENGQGELISKVSPVGQPVSVAQPIVYSPQAAHLQSKKIDEGEANGDSLFDF